MEKRHWVCLCLMAVLMLSACHTGKYKIKGTTEGIADGDTLFISSDKEEGLPSDTIIVSDGHFSFSGKADSTLFCMIYSAKTLEVAALFFAEPGTINVRLSPNSSRVSGTRLNDEWQQLNDSIVIFNTEVNQLLTVFYGENGGHSDNVKERIQTLTDKMSDCIYRTAERNINNELGYVLLLDGSLDPALQLKLINKMPKSFRERHETKERLDDLMTSIDY